MTPLATFLGGLLLASTFYGMPPAESTDAAAARFEKQCAAADTPECKRLRWQLETALYDMLRANPEALDADILRVILWADTPELQTYALERLSEFLDSELAENDGDRIREHLADCEPCLSEYDLEDHIKKLVRRSCTESAPPELHVRIRTRLTVLRGDLPDSRGPA